jgi:hypothetical protein
MGGAICLLWNRTQLVSLGPGELDVSPNRQNTEIHLVAGRFIHHLISRPISTLRCDRFPPDAMVYLRKLASACMDCD